MLSTKIYEEPLSTKEREEVVRILTSCLFDLLKLAEERKTDYICNMPHIVKAETRISHYIKERIRKKIIRELHVDWNIEGNIKKHLPLCFELTLPYHSSDLTIREGRIAFCEGLIEEIQNPS